MINTKHTALFILLLLCISCSRAPSHQMHLSATLRDGGKIIVDVVLVFENKQGLEEIKSKSEQIHRAFRLILKDYKGAQFKEEQRATITKILRRIFNSLITCKVVEIKYNDFKIQKYQPDL